MKAVRGILILAVVLIAGTQVFALTSPPWSGPFRATLSTWSVSRIYTGYLAGRGPASDPDHLNGEWIPAMESDQIRKAYTGAEIANLDYYDPPNAWSTSETGWGVFSWELVKSGRTTAQNNVDTSGGNVLWDDQGAKKIVGMYYGQEDAKVTFTRPDPDDVGEANAANPMNWSQLISSFGAKFKMWYQNEGIFEDGEGYDLNGNGYTMNHANVVDPNEEGWRRRFGEDMYMGLGYYTQEMEDESGGAVQAGDPINDPTVSELVLFGNSYNTPNDSQVQEMKVTYDPMSAETGTLTTFIKLVSDPQYSWQPWPETEDSYFMRIFPFNYDVGQYPPGLEAQLYLHAISIAGNSYGWQLQSSGATAIHGEVVPEPVTMISLALSGMGLVGYIRKRRNK